METKELKTEKANVLLAHRNADAAGKKLLEDLYGKETFGNVMERVKSYRDAQNETGRPDVPAFSDVPEDLRKFFQSIYKVVVINEALNEGTKFNLYDKTVNRHYPWFETNGSPSSFGFFVASYVSSSAHAGGGSRLCLKESVLAKYAGTQFKDEYRDLLDS